MGAAEGEINEAQAGGRLGLTVEVERWPIRGGFTISRGSKHEGGGVGATGRDGRDRRRGGGGAPPRYCETRRKRGSAGAGCASAIASGANRAALGTFLPAGAARNAIDCALWDFEAKRSGRSAAKLAGLLPLHAVETAFTISLASPEVMAAKAREASGYHLLKLKLG